MTSQLIGAVIFFRHGDRQGFYQSPTSYTASNTAITPLGETQEYQLGSLIRSRYIASTSANAIPGMEQTLFDSSQVYMSADAGGEGGVIYDSAVALAQGAWPATSASNTTLANGTTVTSPLGGYQYVPIESVEVADDYTLESWTDCPAYTADNAAWYQSAAFKEKAAENAAFISSVSPLVGGRNTSLQNWWNIFDYMNVNYIHDAAFAANVSASTLAQAQALANWHEYTSFSDPSPDSIGSIAGRAILPVLFEAFGEITNSSNPIKLRMVGMSYKPFIGLFNLTGVAQTYPQLAGIVNYAAAVALEVRQETVTNSYSITLNFKNGTDDADFVPYNMLGSSDAAYDLGTFESTLGPYSVSSLGQWCNLCNNTFSRGCPEIAQINTTQAELDAYITNYGGAASTTGRQHVSPLAAGFIGALVTLAIASAVLGAMYVLGFVAVGKKGSRQAGKRQQHQVELAQLPSYNAKADTA